MPESSELTWEQKARVEALMEARKILLVARPFGPSCVDALDVYNIAEYILTGEDPWGAGNKPVSEEGGKMTETQPEPGPSGQPAEGGDEGQVQDPAEPYEVDTAVETEPQPEPSDAPSAPDGSDNA